MSLSCSCSEWDGEGEVYVPDDDLTVLDKGKYRKKCQSCEVRIKQGDQVLEFKRGRGIETDIEEHIYGEEMKPLAPVYHCAKCGEIYLNLASLGYCQDYKDNMPDALEQYRKEHDSGGWFQGCFLLTN